MDILDLIFSNYDNILVVVALGFILFIAFKYGKKEELWSVVLSLMLDAERLYGAGTGLGKKEDVMGKLPTLFKLVYSKKEVRNIIDTLAKEYGELFDTISYNLEKR